MAFKLNLAQNESIILKEVCVAHGGVMAIYTDELILTNFNVICISKGMFGNTKKVFYYPLNQLKQYKGKVQAICGKLSNGTETLELYFTNGSVESFNFQSDNRKNIRKWIKSISDVLGCECDVDENEIDPNSLAGAINEIGKQVREVGSGFCTALGIKPKNKTENIKSKNTKCISCSAPLVGKEGEVICCKYCDTEQTL